MGEAEGASCNNNNNKAKKHALLHQGRSRTPAKKREQAGALVRWRKSNHREESAHQAAATTFRSVYYSCLPQPAAAAGLPRLSSATLPAHEQGRQGGHVRAAEAAPTHISFRSLNDNHSGKKEIEACSSRTRQEMRGGRKAGARTSVVSGRGSRRLPSTGMRRLYQRATAALEDARLLEAPPQSANFGGTRAFPLPSLFL